MKIARGFYLILLSADAIQASVSPVRLGSSVSDIASGAEDLSHMKSASTFEKFAAEADHNIERLAITPRIKPEPSSAPIAINKSHCLSSKQLRKRRLVLVRRGCAGAVGSGLLSTAEGLSKAGVRLKRFDEFFSNLTVRGKLVWLARKGANGVKRVVRATANGIKNTALILVAGVAILFQGLWWIVSKIGKGIAYVARKSWKGIKVVGRTTRQGAILIKNFGIKLTLHTWRGIGKALAGTGKGIQKAGDRMQAQTAARLAKKVGPPVPH